MKVEPVRKKQVKIMRYLKYFALFGILLAVTEAEATGAASTAGEASMAVGDSTADTAVAGNYQFSVEANRKVGLWPRPSAHVDAWPFTVVLIQLASHQKSSPAGLQASRVF